MLVSGFVLVALSIAGGAYWTLTGRPNKPWALTFSLIGIFSGFVLLVSERAIEISVGGIGTIKAAAAAAESDAAAISDIRESIEAQREEIGRVAATATKADDAVAQLHTTLEFTNTLLAAQSDNRQAFDRLHGYAKEEGPLSSLSHHAIIQLRTEFGGVISAGYLNIPTPEHLTSVPAQKAIATYEQLPSILHPHGVHLIWGRKDISRVDRMDFLASVLASDPSLAATNYAGKFFAKEAQLEWKPFNVQPILEWWEKNRSSFASGP